MAGRKFAHFSGADDHDALVVEAIKDLARQLYGRKRDRDSVAGDRGFGTDPLGHREGFMQETVEDESGGFKLGGIAIGGFDLTKNLRLAKDH